jgi:hypothetical protein
MSPGPAPTLLSDWIQVPGFFWLVLGCIAAVVLAILTVQIVRVWEEDDAANKAAQDDQPEPHECNITGCHQAATNAWPTGVTGVAYYACTGHTNMVRDWAGPYDRTVETVYDQELDQASDLDRWEQEMRS